MTERYRTLFLGTLVQRSSLSAGGTAAEGVDAPLSRDGHGRFTLSGTSLAGALIATARKLYRKLPTYIAGVPTPASDAPTDDSLWTFWTTHPDLQLPKLVAPRDDFGSSRSDTGFAGFARARSHSVDPAKQGSEWSRRIELRQGVGIRQATGAAAAGILFDLETLPRATRWPFRLEVDTSGDDGPAAERIAAAALLEWSRGRCWIGRSVARGLGWMDLHDLVAIRLPRDTAGRWPDSFKDPEVALADVIHELPRVTPVEFPNTFDSGVEPWWQVEETGERRWWYATIRATIQAGERGDGYGIDTLSVAGHVANVVQAERLPNYLGAKSRRVTDGAFEPDMALAMTAGVDGSPEPYIPGSGLRGPLRHAVARQLRRRGVDSVRDPNVIESWPQQGDTLPPDALTLEELFGIPPDPHNDPKQHRLFSARLLIRDAYLSGDRTWTAALLQHHAEDEFAGSAFNKSKFDRVSLLSGSFDVEMVLESPEEAELRRCHGLLVGALRQAQAGALPVGGAKWRGAGWVRWHIPDVDTIAIGQAGDNTSATSQEGPG